MASRRRTKELGPVPDAHVLHELALASLARRAVTRSALEQVLKRRLDKWARDAVRAGRDADEAARDVDRARGHVQAVVARLVELGLVNDARFATMRAERLSRSGKSRRAISMHLTQKGVDAETTRAALPTEPEDELRAALVLARRKRIGPFANEDAEATRDEQRAARQKAFAALARAGFDMSTVERVFRLSRDEADEQLRERGTW